MIDADFQASNPMRILILIYLLRKIIYDGYTHRQTDRMTDRIALLIYRL